MKKLLRSLLLFTTVGDTTPGGTSSAFLLETGTFGFLLEDGSSDLLMEA